MRNELGDAKQCGLRVSGRVRLRDWISDFSQVSLLIICCTEIVLLVRSRLKQLGWLHEGGGVWCVVAIEVTLSYDHASLLLIAVFLKWEFFMALKREMKQEIKNLRFFPPSFPPVLFIHSWCLQTVVVPRFYSPRTQVTGIHIFNSFKWSENWFFFCWELSHIFWKWNGLFSQLDGNMTVILWKKIINASNFQTFQK